MAKVRRLALTLKRLLADIVNDSLGMNATLTSREEVRGGEKGGLPVATFLMGL
jgi:hypothetical protein